MDIDWSALGSWLSHFAQSPGFGGLAAVGAAMIAFNGVRRSVELQREVDRKARWWDRARWALDLLTSDVEQTRVIGINVLTALSTSEYADEHEDDLVKAVLESIIEDFENEPSQADLEPGDGGGDERS